MAERELVKGVLDWLEVRGIFAWRNNSGSLPVGDRFVKFGKKGSGDIFAVLPGGRFMSIECKSKGKYPTPEQRAFIARVNLEGGLAFVARTIDDVVDMLRREV